MGLCALSLAILHGLALVVAGLVVTFYRRLCPDCGKRGLKSKTFIKGVLCREYFVCERCRAGYKRDRVGWSRVEGHEYEQHCAGGSAKPVNS